MGRSGGIAGVPRRLAVACVLTALAGCAGGPPAVDAAPFAGLVQCGDEPYVAVFRGFTTEGMATEKAGSAPSSDVYGLRPDGTVERFTTDLGTYEFGISADAAIVFAAPYPTAVPGDPSHFTDQVLAIDTWTRERTQLAEATGIGAITPSPDGSVLAVSGTIQDDAPAVRGRLALLDVAHPDVWHRLPGFDATAPHGDRDPAWSPDGRSLAYVAEHPDLSNEIRVVEATTGEERVVYGWDGRSESLYSLDWSPDGRFLLTNRAVRLALGKWVDEVVELDVAAGTATVVLPGVHGQFVYSAADGSRITAFDNDPEQPLTARSWTRQEDGTFALASSAPFGARAGLLGADELDIPACALGSPGT